MNAALDIEELLRSSSPVTAEPWQLSLVDAVMKGAAAYSSSAKAPFGRCLAAGFDLIVAAHYYGNVANRGWLYCGPRDSVLLYPYTNTCPRCALRSQFFFHKANKPKSGKIGSITSTYLCLCYQWYFEQSDHKSVQVFFGQEPVDVFFVDRLSKFCLLAEIKASPLVTFPLAMVSDQLTEETENGLQQTTAHQEVAVPRLDQSELSILLPEGSNGFTLISLGRKAGERDPGWAALAIEKLCKDGSFFETYYKAWTDAFLKYSGEVIKAGSFWLTNSCGSPSPMPCSWPKRSNGSGYETISDNKTSVGMDRTDDIKKGTYQVLKIGSVSKFPKSPNWHIAVALVSNVHAVTHYDDYLASISDVMWTKTGDRVVETTGELPSDTRIANLFDGVISFTSLKLRDDWLKRIFRFE